MSIKTPQTSIKTPQTSIKKAPKNRQPTPPKTAVSKETTTPNERNQQHKAAPKHNQTNKGTRKAKKKATPHPKHKKKEPPHPQKAPRKTTTMKNTAPPRALRGRGFTGAEPPTATDKPKTGNPQSGSRQKTQPL